MKPHEIEETIADRLTPEALTYWNGMTSHSDIVIHAQREGIDTAVQVVEDLAKPEDA